MSETITFLASFPPIQSAIKRDGSGGGMRIQLDIPESQMAQAALLFAMVQKQLKVTVETVNNAQDTAPSRRKVRKRE